MMRRSFQIAGIILSLIVFSSCTGRPSGEEPVARVNGKEIRLRDYMNLYETMKPRDIELVGNERLQMRNVILQTLIRRAVIIKAAEQLKIAVSEKELLSGIEKYKQGYPEQIFQETLFEGMVDESDWKEQVRQNLLIGKLFEASEAEIQSPSNEEKMQYYQDNPHQFKQSAQVRSQHIAVGDEDLALEIRKKLKSDPKQFSYLAREHSIGPEAQDDAIIEVEKGTMPSEIDDVLFTIPLKQISQVIKSPYGFHLFYVLSRRPSVNLDFKQVSKEIGEKLLEERKQRWIEKYEEDLIRSAEIEYNRELIKSL